MFASLCGGRPSTEGLLLRSGEAKVVPPGERGAVLHLHEALSPQLLEQHGSDNYIHALEIAAALAEAFEDSEEDQDFAAYENAPPDEV